MLSTNQKTTFIYGGINDFIILILWADYFYTQIGLTYISKGLLKRDWNQLIVIIHAENTAKVDEKHQSINICSKYYVKKFDS